MSFFNFLFRRKQITYLGRGGLKYFDGKDDFYIDTNNIQGNKLRIEIFRNDIRKISNNDHKTINTEFPLTDSEKNYLALKVKKLLEAKGIEVGVTPPLSIDLIENE